MSTIRTALSTVLIAAFAVGYAVSPARADDNLAAILSGSNSVSSNLLASQRGAGLNPDAVAIANVSGNAVAFTKTGDNGVLNSLNDAKGVFTVFQNTGNNVAMQSQTILNLNLH